MAAATSDADRARWERAGIAPFADDEGLALLDAARAAARPFLVPVGLDMAALRAQAKAGVLPPILSGLVRAPARRAGGDSLERKLAGAPESEWHSIILELIRGHV